MNERDAAALGEIVRLCDIGANLVARGREWYLGDADNVPGLAAESLIIKIGENVARLSVETTDRHPEVPWSLIKRMRDRLAHHYEGTDYEAVWDTLVVDLPTISRYVQSLATTGWEVRPIDLSDVAVVQRVLESNPEYTLRVSGTPPTATDAQDVLTAGPPGVAVTRKVDIGLWEHGSLVAFADVIRGWPSSDTAHVGLLMTDGARHGQGLGRRMHDAVLDLARSWPEITTLRLSVVDTNADRADAFWSRLGYRPTGEAKPYVSGCVESTARIWARPVGLDDR